MQRIGPYTLVRRIASGGMAEVWMARREAPGGASKSVAIKLLAAHLGDDPIYQKMFVDEARLTMMLSHSNIVQVFDVGVHGGRSYLVMEWVDGLDLAQLATSLRELGQPMPVGVIAHVIGELLRGLAYAHELTFGAESSAIVHRDISPHNLLISASGEVKITDFGVARLVSEETSGVHVRGKLRYMPPEQLRGDSSQPTVDLFAVGAVLQELLDGTRFRADSSDRDELLGAVLHGQVPPLQRRNVPSELVRLRDGLLACDRDARIQTAQDALALLHRWPGYRNAADELAELVRTHAGLTAPRSGLGVACSDEQLQTFPQPSPADPNQSSATTPSLGEVLDPAPVSKSKRAPIWIGVGATLGLLLGVTATWTAIDHAETDSVAVEPPLVVGAPVTPAVGSKPSPAAAPSVAVAHVESVASKPRSPAKVEFAAHEFFFVWVKIDGRELALEPTAKVSLEPGKHRVQIRESPDRPWRDAGRIEIVAGRRYRVSLRKPGSLSIERVTSP